jgi:hypothetical protein
MDYSDAAPQFCVDSLLRQNNSIQTSPIIDTLHRGIAYVVASTAHIIVHQVLVSNTLKLERLQRTANMC